MIDWTPIHETARGEMTGSPYWPEWMESILDWVYENHAQVVAQVRPPRQTYLNYRDMWDADVGEMV